MGNFAQRLQTPGWGGDERKQKKKIHKKFEGCEEANGQSCGGWWDKGDDLRTGPLMVPTRHNQGGGGGGGWGSRDHRKYVREIKLLPRFT